MKDYTSMRVTANVRDALLEYRDRLQAQVLLAKPGRFPDWLGRNLSLSDALEYLLVQQVRHSERGRTSRKARQETINLLDLIGEHPPNTEGTVSE